jgi:cell division septum initiation protein DivIVA
MKIKQLVDELSVREVERTQLTAAYSDLSQKHQIIVGDNQYALKNFDAILGGCNINGQTILEKVNLVIDAFLNLTKANESLEGEIKGLQKSLKEAEAKAKELENEVSMKVQTLAITKEIHEDSMKRKESETDKLQNENRSLHIKIALAEKDAEDFKKKCADRSVEGDNKLKTQLQAVELQKTDLQKIML